MGVGEREEGGRRQEAQGNRVVGNCHSIMDTDTCCTDGCCLQVTTVYYVSRSTDSTVTAIGQLRPRLSAMEARKEAHMDGVPGQSTAGRQGEQQRRAEARG